MTRLYIHHHLGLGDHITCNGLVRTLLEREGKIVLFVKERNLKSVKRMYDDTDGIDLFPLSEGNDDCFSVSRVMETIGENGRLLKVGFNQLFAAPNMNFDEVFYVFSGVPFDNRWSKFYVRRDAESEERVLLKLNPSREPYMFVHDDPSRGFHLSPPNPNNLKVIKNDPSEDIFSMLGVLEAASEIHCMESSIRCLIESIPSIRCPLYLHRKVRSLPGLPEYVATGRKHWIEA